MRRRPKVGKWVYGLAAVPPIVGVLVAWLAPQQHGHWTEHLTSVGLGSTQLLLVVGLVAMLGWGKLPVLSLISLVAVGVGIGFQLLGNLEVAQSIWRTSGNPGFGVGYEHGHDMASTGDGLVVIGGLAFALGLGLARRIPLGLVIVAAVMVIIPPPFIWPAAGVLVLVLYGLTSERGSTQPASMVTA